MSKITKLFDNKLLDKFGFINTRKDDSRPLKYYSAITKPFKTSIGHTRPDIQGGPESSRQSNLAIFTIKGKLDSKFSYVN